MSIRRFWKTSKFYLEIRFADTNDKILWLQFCSRFLLSMVKKLEDDAESQPSRQASLLEAPAPAVFLSFLQSPDLSFLQSPEMTLILWFRLHQSCLPFMMKRKLRSSCSLTLHWRNVSWSLKRRSLLLDWFRAGHDSSADKQRCRLRNSNSSCRTKKMISKRR